MSNGLGAGVAGLTLLAALVGLALALAVVGAATAATLRRWGTRGAPLRYAPLVLLAGVLAVAGFAVAALVDEAPVLAWLFAALVAGPLGVAGWRLHRSRSLPRRDVAGVAAVGWSLPFVAGVVVAVGLVAVAGGAGGLTSGEVRALGVPWATTAVGGLLAAAGAVVLADRLAARLEAAGE